MQPKKILLIDDNVDFLTTLSSALQCFEYDVEVAYTGYDGVQKYETRTPDIVVCDIGLPDMNGYIVAMEIIKLSKLKSKKVSLLALSGYSKEMYKDLATGEEFSAHFTKPVNLENLLDFFMKV